MKKLITTLSVACIAYAASAQMVSSTSIYVSEGAVLSIGQEFENSGLLVNKGTLHLQNDLANEGSIQSEGILVVDGINKQTFKGSQAASVSNLVIENELTLANNLNIEKEATFNNGIVHSSDKYPLAFGANASYIGASDYSHVQGAVKKENAKDFTFPLGDGSMLHAFNAASNGTLVGNYYGVNPLSLSSNLDLNVENINAYEYWTLKSEDTNEANVSVENESIAYLDKGAWTINSNTSLNNALRINSGLVFTSGKGKNVQKAIGIWPNPTQGEFNLKLEGMKDQDRVTVEVLSITGQTMLKETGKVRDLRKVYELPNGLFTSELTVRVIKGEEILTEKLILKK